jgi:hypothetical protein
MALDTPGDPDDAGGDSPHPEGPFGASRFQWPQQPPPRVRATWGRFKSPWAGWPKPGDVQDFGDWPLPARAPESP